MEPKIYNSYKTQKLKKAQIIIRADVLMKTYLFKISKLTEKTR